jgi:hypothetical protein
MCTCPDLPNKFVQQIIAKICIWFLWFFQISFWVVSRGTATAWYCVMAVMAVMAV